MGKIVKAATGVVDSVFGGGGGNSPGILGTGKFKGTKQEIDEEPFKRRLEGGGVQERARREQVGQSSRLTREARGLMSEARRGKKPSLAEAQLKAASERTLAQQLAAAQAARGGSAGLRERQLAKGAAEARRDVSQQAVEARLKEQRDIEAEQRALRGEALQREQLVTQATQARRAQDINLAESDRAAQQRLQELLVNENLGVQGLNLSGFQSAAQQRSGLVSNIGSGLAAAFSDKDLKKNIKSESGFKNKEEIIKHNKAQAKKGIELKKKRQFKEKLGKAAAAFSESAKTQENKPIPTTGMETLQSARAAISDKNLKVEVEVDEKDFNPKSFLDALQAYSYEYKNNAKKLPTAGEGRHLSVMAQDLEKAGPVGKSMVIDTPNGKVVDYGKGFGAILAAQTHLNERLKELESKKKR